MDAIITKNLTKQYNSKIVVDNFSIQVEQGNIFSLLGTNGAGKTTIINMLTTLIKPTSGIITIFGYNAITNTDMIKKIINVCPQEIAIAENLTVYENLTFFSGIYHISNSKKQIQYLITTFKLENVLHQKTKTLSGGYKRKLSIAIALINNPKILFLDEPTLGLDIISRTELWQIIKKIKKDTTIILTTHYMEEAEILSDKIAILDKGKLLVLDTPKNLMHKYNKKTIEDVFTTIILGEK